MTFKNIHIIPKSIQSYVLITIISIYAFYINWLSANMGVMVIDTFSFFDSSFSILQNKLPIRDFWAFTGIFVDYMQAIFFLVFGKFLSDFFLISKLCWQNFDKFVIYLLQNYFILINVYLQYLKF